MSRLPIASRLHRRMMWPYRFFRLVKIIVDANSCWDWQGSFHQDGYGKFRLPGPERKTRAAHIVMWLLIFGSIPLGKLVLHKCVNNKGCVRPSHLYLGNKSDNALDYWAVKSAQLRSRPHLIEVPK